MSLCYINVETKKKKKKNFKSEKNYKAFLMSSLTIGKWKNNLFFKSEKMHKSFLMTFCYIG